MHTSTDSVRIVLYGLANPNEFVALSETDDPDNIKLPGGKFEGDESPDQAAERELGEELGLAPEQVNLVRAGELVNEDGSSKRYIYTGRVAWDLLRPSDEIHHVEPLTIDSIPAGKNQGHIRSAVALTQHISFKS